MAPQPPMSVPLADMVDALRLELDKAMKRSQGQDLSFIVDKVELELKVELEHATEVKGGIKFWVVSAEGGQTLSRGDTHIFKLTLEPVFKGGKTRISDSVGERPP